MKINLNLRLRFIFKVDSHAPNGAPIDDENWELQYNLLTAGEGRSNVLGAVSP
jgi:hypothetical protein